MEYRKIRALLRRMIADIDRRLQVPVAPGLSSPEVAALHAKLNRHTCTLGSVIVSNLLCNRGIIWVGELVQLTEAEFLRLKSSSRIALMEAKGILHEMGLRFGMTPEELHGWEPPDQRK